MSAEHGNETLQRTFNSGEHSDLRVDTADTTFKLHKSVLGAASEHLRWKIPLLNSDILDLDESDLTVKVIIHHCYGIDVELVADLQDNLTPAMAAIDLYRAAYRYELHRLQQQIETALIGALENSPLSMLLSFGICLYEHKVRDQDPQSAELFVPFIRLVVQRTGQNIHDMISDPFLWHRLLACPIFPRHAMRFAVCDELQAGLESS